MPPRARITPEPPPVFPPFPTWARNFARPNSERRTDAGRPAEARIIAGRTSGGRSPALGDAVADASFFAGAALAAIHPIARDEHPLGSLWRQRLALANAAALARLSGRTEDEAALRDAWYLRREDDDPGPAGRILKTWRWLGERSAMLSDDWMVKLGAMLDLRFDEALEDVLDFAVACANGQGSAVAAAAAAAAASVRLRPDSPLLALWLADAVLARRLNWPAPVPLIGGQIRRGDFVGAANGHADGDSAWLTACSLAYARAAAAASDLYADLGRRAERLRAAAPQLRGKDADLMIFILIGEDAQPARTGRTASDRSSRRLFERLVSLGAVRELTGRPTFRLYGL